MMMMMMLFLGLGSFENFGARIVKVLPNENACEACRLHLSSFHMPIK